MLLLFSKQLLVVIIISKIPDDPKPGCFWETLLCIFVSSWNTNEIEPF